MDHCIVPRCVIAQQAERAAAFHAEGRSVQNPYPEDTAAGLEWQASFDRYLQAHTAPESEASA